MTLLVNIDEHNYVVDWRKPIEDFPQAVLFNASYFEWVFYGKGKTADYDLIFSKMSPGDPRIGKACVFFSDLLTWTWTPPSCDCGAQKVGSPGHSNWCSVSK